MRILGYFNIIVFIILFISAGNATYASEPSRSKNGMVVTAEPLATKVGAQILKKGGNAVDAAVAVGFALAVTYPTAGNLGGGGYMVIHLKDGTQTTIDYRETAPKAALKDMFIDSSGKFQPKLSQEGATSAGVPGSVAGLLHALEKYGSMKLADVIQPAINLAKDGFPLTYYTAKMFEGNFKEFKKYESSMKVFSKDGKPFEEGDIFKQSDLARSLELIKQKGLDGFYKGKTADLIIEQMKKMNGYITHEDLENYTVIEREPVKGSYKDFEIISMPPSSSGGIALIQMLNILENYEFNKDEWGSSDYYHKLVETMRYTYADRSKHLGDPAFYNVPQNWLISKEYAKEIFKNIKDRAAVSREVNPGVPPKNESEETTHYSIADKYGNAVSVTTTINAGFGSSVVVDGAGFLLNNEMDDFSAQPGVPNMYGLLGSEANSIQPGKRMLSSMTPAIVLKDNKPFLVVGTPGGSTIITIVLQVIFNCIQFNMNLENAMDAPRIHHQWFPDEIQYERFAFPTDVKNNLVERGHKIGRQRGLGLVESIMIDQSSGVFYGVSDKRGAGLAEGF
jgi:gamma-glutamyltranspeptidase/glutathione hydrolase